MNVPICRAKKIDSDEWIIGTGTTDFLNINNIEGFEHYNDGSRLWLWSNYCWMEVDSTTLAINFEDMLDSQGNKIFASLNKDGKDGKGGSILIYPDYDENKYVCVYNKLGYKIGIILIESDEMHCWESGGELEEKELELFEARGIQE